MSRLFALMSSVWLAFVVLLAMAIPVNAAAPTITSFLPKGGKVGDVITITGTNFTGTTTVKFNTTAASAFSVASDTSITATVPAGATTGYISVTSSDYIKATSITAFAVYYPPTITSFAPTNGRVGQLVTITGTNLTAVTGVSFNGTPALSYTVDSATQISTYVPTGATTGLISVTTPYFTVGSANDFTVNPPIVQSGTIQAWGSLSVALGSYNGFTAISAGFNHLLGLKRDGSVVGIGNNNYGKCIVPDPNMDFIAVAAGYYHSVGLKRDGTIICWGSNSGGQCTVPEPNQDFVAIYAGIELSAGIKSDGTVICWGTSAYGQANVPEPNKDFTSVTVGGQYHAMGLKRNGSLTPWGTDYGLTRMIPIPNQEFVAISSGADYELGLKLDGSLISWGANLFALPTPNRDFTAITSSWTHAAGLKSDSTLVAWGPNDVGQCNVPEPNSGFMAVSAGNNFTAAIRITPPPTITSFNPTSGIVGQVVTITGTNFTGTTDVDFNGTVATFTVDNDTTITTSVPAGTTTGPISVTNGGGTATSASLFTVYQPPTITSFTPTSGAIGQEITISGTNLTGTTDVSINGTTASYTVNSDVSITTHVPAGATTGKISVTNLGGSTVSADVFTVILAPTITSFTPTSGNAGSSVIITGTNFTGTTNVSFNGASAVFTVNNSTSITATVPTDATTGKITVTNPAGTATSAMDFTAFKPTITSFTPASGKVGDSIVISGTYFTPSSVVKFNGTLVTDRTVTSATSITATVPEGATSGKITVTTPGGTATSASDFYVAPTITSFAPGSGKAGDVITITGTNLTGATAVAFNGLPALAFTVVSATSITATVPSGITPGKMAVTTAGGTAESATDFLVTPAISSFTPTSGSVGITVTITGTSFTGATAVKFNGLAATAYTVASDTSITVTVPDGATSGKITVTTPGGTATSATDFYVAPTIISFAPTSGKLGDVITITGTNLTGASAVDINGTNVPTYTVVSNTSITTTVPSGATTGKITVTTAGGTATSDTDFTVYQQPTITSFTPTSGSVGITVTITGTNLTGATEVKFNGLAVAVYTVVSDTSITVTVPDGATTGKVAVITPGGTATSADNFYVAPTIISFSPGSGKAGDVITITGTNFTGATAVAFNGLSASAFTVVSATSITATVPVGATSGKITVTTLGGTATSATDFYVTPTIASFTPTSGKIGDTITITGTNFTGATNVKFNGLAATTYAVVSDTSITATVPDGATSGTISVTTPGGTATSATDFYVAPTITSFAPSSGKLGDVVTITGTNFTGTTAVDINGTNMPTFTVVGNTSIKATVPDGATTGRIAVTTPGGAATSDTDFTVYQLPTITSFTPVSGSVGITVTITGTNLTGATDMKFNGLAATAYTVVSDTSITVTVPDGATSGKIAITTLGGTATSASDFYVAPTIASFAPGSGKVGDVITIIGTNLSGATAVAFNGLAVSAFTVVSATSITATIPVGATSGKITVTTLGGTTTSATDFYVAPTITSFTPTSGKIGDTITITGINLTGATAVKFNGLAATTYVVVSDTSITATVPEGATSGKITVVTPGGTATSETDFNVAPTIITFEPAIGTIGDVITITGTIFTGVTAVKFNGTSAPLFNIGSATSITVTVPTGATTGKITVTTAGGTATSATDFTVYHPTSLEVTINPGPGYIGAVSNITMNYSLAGPKPYSGPLTIDQSGKSLINGLQPGTYDLTISGSHWLRRIIRNINVNGANGANVSLANGDANGDSQVNLFDFVVLDMRFGSTNAMADLDGDGNVNLFDYMIIDMNFGAQGD